MSMQIKFNDDYKFTVEVYWNSIDKKYIVKGVEFTDDISVNFDKDKAVIRIKSLVKEWYTLDE